MLFGLMEMPSAMEPMVSKRNFVEGIAPKCSMGFCVVSKTLIDAVRTITMLLSFPLCSKKHDKEVTDTQPEARDAW